MGFLAALGGGGGAAAGGTAGAGAAGTAAGATGASELGASTALGSGAAGTSAAGASGAGALGALSGLKEGSGIGSVMQGSGIPGVMQGSGVSKLMSGEGITSMPETQSAPVAASESPIPQSGGMGSNVLDALKKVQQFRKDYLGAGQKLPMPQMQPMQQPNRNRIQVPQFQFPNS